MKEHATLDWLLSRRSVRDFSDRPVARETLENLLLAATSAPSATNRQPWQFAVVRSGALRAAIVNAVRERAEEMKAIIQRGHHAEDFGNYGDFFHEPLLSAAVIIIPQYRAYPDLIANLLASGGADPAAFHTAGSMQAELCSTSAAVMNLLLQAHASGLGACWMAGPMIARDRICHGSALPSHGRWWAPSRSATRPDRSLNRNRASRRVVWRAGTTTNKPTRKIAK